MFWKFNLLTSHIDTLLDKEDVTLQEILDEDDVLQECKSQNQRLLEFLIRPDNIEELVNLITQEPATDIEESVKYKYPNIACELLTSDVNKIVEKVAGDDALLNKIYAFLESDGSLNPLLASFFSKTLGILINRKSELMLEFLASKEDFVGQLLRHLDTSAIMDLLLRLISCIENPECHHQCLAWLSEKNLITRLVAMIDPKETDEKHCNAAQSLCDIIRLSRENMSQLQEKADNDPLLSCIESQDTVMDLLNHMFAGEKVDSVLVNGMSIIQTLLEYRRLSVYPFSPEGGIEQMTALDTERLAYGVHNTLQALIPRLKDLNQLLQEPPKQHFSPMPTTLGMLAPPLGNTRLQVTRLVSSIVLTNNHSVNQELANLKTISLLLDLCFKYSWNNFLHAHVEQCIGTIIENGPSEEGDEKIESPLLCQLLTEFTALERLLEAWEDNEQQLTRTDGRRRGYMGHLTKITNSVVNGLERGPNADRLKECYKDLSPELRERWEKFVSGTLAEVNKNNTVDLVSMIGGHGLQSSSEDDVDEFRDIPFPGDSMQQARRKARLFGYNEDDFTEQEERVDAKFTEKISSISFEINTNEDTQAATLFEQACNERLQQFDDNDSDEDLWEEKEITFSPTNPAKPTRKAGGQRPEEGTPGSDEEEEEESEESSGSEEELDSPRQIRQTIATSSTASSAVPMATAENMEVDSSENWANFDDMSMETGTDTAVDSTTANPWDRTKAAGQPSSTSAETWADFGDTVPSTTTAVTGNEASQAGPPRSGTALWADFTSYSDIESTNLSSTEPIVRSGSPVAMETSDTTNTSNRTAKYLMSSAPADLATAVSEAAAGQLPSTSSAQPTQSPSIQQSNNTSEEPQPPASSDQAAVGAGAGTGAAAGAGAPTLQSTQVAEISSTWSPSPSSTSPSMVATVNSNGSPTLDSTPLNATSPPPSLPDARVTTSLRQNHSASPASLAEDVARAAAAEAAREDEEDGADDDLSDNFNFLSASGLMKSMSDSPAAASSPAIQNNSSQSADEPPDRPPPPPPASADQIKCEEARAQAKEALEQYTEATQNGPV